MNQFVRQSCSVFTVVGFLALQTLSVRPCHSQDAKTEAPPTAESVLDRHVQATGGKDSQRALKSKVMSGTFANDLGGHKFQTEITVTSVAPNKQHIAMHHPQFNLVRATNGVKAWEWRGEDANHRHSDETEAGHVGPGQTKWLEKPEAAQAIEKAVFNAHLDWRKNFKTVKTIGVVDVDSKPAFEVSVTTRDGEKYSQFYDKQSGRLVRVTRSVKSSALGDYKIDSIMNQYKEFDGIWLVTKYTHTLETESMGVGTQSYEFSDVKLNSDVPDSLFKIPTELVKTTTNQK